MAEKILIMSKDHKKEHFITNSSDARIGAKDYVVRGEGTLRKGVFTLAANRTRWQVHEDKRAVQL